VKLSLPFFSRNSTRRLTDAVRNGVGVRERSWQLPPRWERGTSVVSDEILRWVRDAMGSMRRPYGIDQVALALACRDAKGRIVCSNSLGVLKPGAFYTNEGATRVEAFLDDVGFADPGDGAEIIAALLSLGDVAYEMGRAKAA
jgi:hypothetical protein